MPNLNQLQSLFKSIEHPENGAAIQSEKTWALQCPRITLLKNNLISLIFQNYCKFQENKLK